MATVKSFNRDNGSGVIDLGDGTGPMPFSLEADQITSEIADAQNLAYALHVPEIGAPWLSELRPL
jgi:hypothetical protein